MTKFQETIRIPRRESGPPPLQSLTALRFVFALGIVLFHLKFVLPTFYAWRYFDKLEAGVQMFFVLSGFVLYYNYGRLSRLRLKEFYIRRFARIYPLLPEEKAHIIS